MNPHSQRNHFSFLSTEAFSISCLFYFESIWRESGGFACYPFPRFNITMLVLSLISQERRSCFISGYTNPLYSYTIMAKDINVDIISDNARTPGGEIDDRALEQEYLEAEKGKMNTIQVTWFCGFVKI